MFISDKRLDLEELEAHPDRIYDLQDEIGSDLEFDEDDNTVRR